jgi:hypothetical protein
VRERRNPQCLNKWLALGFDGKTTGYEQMC